MQLAPVCNNPVLNYIVTFKLDANNTRTVPNTTTFGDLICVAINKTVGLLKDQAIDYTVTACNNVTCRSTEKYTACKEYVLIFKICTHALNKINVVKNVNCDHYTDTTDIQNPTVYFTQDSNTMLLTCEFATGSNASGCLFILTPNITGEVGPPEEHIVPRNSKINSSFCHFSKACMCVTISYTDYLAIEAFSLDHDEVRSGISLTAFREDVSKESENFSECQSPNSASKTGQD